MPNLSESGPAINAVAKVSLLLIGDTKAGKTDYAMRAAEAGFHVLYLDGDVAIQTLLDKSRGLKGDALARVQYLPIHDYMNDAGMYVPFMAKFLVEFTTQGIFTWNDTKSRIFSRNDYTVERADPSDPESPVVSGDVVWQIRPASIGSDTVIILDSWTNLVHSLQQWKAQDLGIDILDIEKQERDMYTGTAHKATQFLHLLRTLRSHLIVIGHPREYRKMSVPNGSKGNVPEKDMVVDWTRQVPMSTSNPHALTMGKNFSDIGWIDVTGAGTRFIDFRPSDKRVIGGHTQAREKVEDFPFGRLVEHIGGKLPNASGTPEWLKVYGPGEFVPAGAKPVAPLTGSNESTAKKVGGLAGLMNKKNGG